MNTESVKQKYFAGYKSYLVLLLKLLIAAGIIYYLITYIDFNKVLLALNNSDLTFIYAAAILSILNIYLQFLKWKLTCSQVLNENSNSKILTSLFYGFSAGVITPIRIGEYFGRAIAFKDKSVLQTTVATLIDKFFPLLIVAFLGSMSMIIFIYLFYDVSIYIASSLFILLFTFFYFLFVLIKTEKFWDSIFFSKLRSIKKLNRFFDKLQVLKKLDRVYFTKMSLISFLFYACFLIQYSLLVTGFSQNTEFANYLWAGNLIMFAKTIIPPISFGELGIREGASVFFLTQFGETSEVAFNASIFLFLINIFIPALFGLVLLIKKNND
ncbi:hypothetical protein BMS3Abin03_00786 [bacterium BMS3Abin03]|nr:hypothetical protein BMS3Abin03_00786 [bacterium BMS3Abin03]